MNVVTMTQEQNQVEVEAFDVAQNVKEYVERHTSNPNEFTGFELEVNHSGDYSFVEIRIDGGVFLSVSEIKKCETEHLGFNDLVVHKNNSVCIQFSVLRPEMFNTDKNERCY